MRYKFNEEFYEDLNTSLASFKNGEKNYYGGQKVTEEDIVALIDWALKEEMDKIFDKLLEKGNEKERKTKKII